MGRTHELASGMGANVWVGIPAFEASSTTDLTIFESGASRVLASLVAAGMEESTPVIYIGHSDGGAMVEAFVYGGASSSAAVAAVLLGSFIPRTHYANFTDTTLASTTGYSLPLMTVAGDLDGVCRATRAAVETYFNQITLASDGVTAYLDFPVALLEGISHVQFADGTSSFDDVLRDDLTPESTNDDATAAIAATVVDFIIVHAMSSSSSGYATAYGNLMSTKDTTAAWVEPLSQAFKLEGYHYFYTPCESDYPTNPTCGYTQWPDAALPPGPVDAPDPLPPSDCQCGSPFVMDTAQLIMAGFQDSAMPDASATVADSFHDVSDTHPFHLPHIFDSCAGDSANSADCILNSTTVTMPIYEDADSADTGFAPVSAIEFRTKLKSRQAMWEASGLDVNSKDDTDATDFNICGAINQASLDWALASASEKALERYNSYGEKLVITADKEAPIGATGPEWIELRLNFERVTASSGAVATAVNVSSWSFTTENYNKGDVPYIVTAGYHYCKILSPARALEWVYVDSLRMYGAVEDSSDVTAQCETCVAALDPVGLSASSSWCWIDEACYTVGDTSNPCSAYQCASQASLSECECDSCSVLTCSM
uniref:Uncharacterized protein n=1 Tax=Octactis speculum TaxID=3111310 RepID=A0A7S2MSG7_9STRA|mmetsp:Transcript_9404/g.12192  ORF Transcript_9404/g.12192 Transcript_9404/m.12192 type:complete len:600 (+) Transcript_9404:2-1801(+)